MRTFFTADWHFNDDSVLDITWRNFPSIEEHNEVLLDEVNKTVSSADRLFVLGDVGSRGFESIKARILCQNLHLIVGNHDRAKTGKLFKSVDVDASIHIVDSNGIKHQVELYHYAGAYWNGSHRGSIQLYGHTHALRESTLDAIWPERRSMDVGVDNARRLLGKYRPFSEDEILSLLLPRSGHDDVNFYRSSTGKVKQ